MSYKKRPKNKQELTAKSGAKRKPVIRDRILFEFEVNNVTYKNGENARLKLDSHGYFTYVIKKDGKWQNVKGQLKKLKLIKEKKVAGHTKKNV